MTSVVFPLHSSQNRTIIFFHSLPEKGLKVLHFLMRKLFSFFIFGSAVWGSLLRNSQKMLYSASPFSHIDIFIYSTWQTWSTPFKTMWETVMVQFYSLLLVQFSCVTFFFSSCFYCTQNRHLKWKEGHYNNLDLRDSLTFWEVSSLIHNCF